MIEPGRPTVKLAVLSLAMPELPVLDYDAVLDAVSPEIAIERVREALLRHHSRRLGDAGEGLPREPAVR